MRVKLHNTIYEARRAQISNDEKSLEFLIKEGENPEYYMYMIARFKNSSKIYLERLLSDLLITGYIDITSAAIFYDMRYPESCNEDCDE